MPNETFDIVIIGAGLSGIGVACRLAQSFPNKSMVILERRQNIGGTWDLFRFPGIRSDSDVASYGYEFRPWKRPEILASGGEIQSYIDDTALEFGIRDKIRFNTQVVESEWSDELKRWSVTTQSAPGSERQVIECKFLIACTGYYSHAQGYLPDYPGVDEFQGVLIHPQHWPADLDHTGKRVVIIGSGATAVTLAPAMAKQAGQVTMLQRSPSYIHSVPEYDPLAEALKRILPDDRAHRFIRKRNILIQRGIHFMARRFPNLTRRFLLSHMRKRLGPNADMRHFTPRYAPWDERLCVVPNSDLFHAVRDGDVTMVTDRIKTFTGNGILTESGEELQADIIVSATGFTLQTLGGSQLKVNGKHKELGELLTYKGVLAQDLPNFATVFGYVNLTWTLKVDLTASYLCRLLQYMAESGFEVVVPRCFGDEATTESVMSKLNSGYVQRGQKFLPRQGRKAPWVVTHNYRIDRNALTKQPITDKHLEFR